MSRPLRTRGDFAQDTLTAEFTTGQIVIMASIALMVAGAMFGLGVLVGRVDSPPPAAPAAELATPDEPPAAASAPSVVVAERVPESPEPDASPVTPRERVPDDAPPPAAAAPTIVSEPTSAETEGQTEGASDAADAPAPVTTLSGTLGDNLKRVKRVEALPLTTAGAPAAPRISTTPPLPQDPPAAGAATPEEAPSASSKPPAAAAKPAQPLSVNDDMEQAPLLEEMPETKVASNVQTAKREEPVKEAETVEPAAGGLGKFGIRVGSFKGAGAKDKAEALSRKFTSSHGPVRVVPGGDGATFRVMIVGFKEKSAANAVLPKVKAMVGFSDAFVKPLS